MYYQERLKVCLTLPIGKVLTISFVCAVNERYPGSEYRSWLLFYCLPVLKDTLPNPYFTHLSLLVTGLWLLSSQCITDEDLHIANECLTKFYKEFSDLYGML